MHATVKPARKIKSGSTSSASAARRSIELPTGLWERISSKAYELWEQRGRREGDALRDWLEAEEIVMEEIHEARE
ncbi:MAG: DUF2934 domain-containing protein [Nitrospira sp. CR1.3]|nr:DUF2934 domain-containing protein [Nitrospira sp. CR1.3]